MTPPPSPASWWASSSRCLWHSVVAIVVDCEPRVFLHLRKSVPLLRFLVQKAENEILRLRWKLSRKLDVVALDHAIEILCVLIIERQKACKQSEENNTTRPCIYLISTVTLLVTRNDLRSTIIGTSTLRMQKLLSSTRAPHGGKTKVSNLELTSCFVDEEVLRFEIAMANASSMAILNTVDELLKVSPGDVFLQLALIEDFGEELAASDKVHDDVELALTGEDLTQIDDVAMLESLHDGDLASDIHGHFLGLDVALVHDLDGDLFARLFMDAKLDPKENAVTHKVTRSRRNEMRGSVIHRIK